MITELGQTGDEEPEASLPEGFLDAVKTRSKPPAAELKEIPPHLARPLSKREKTKALKRRDDLMALHTSAARLSEHERKRAHAITCSTEYQGVLDSLLALRDVSFKERGMTKPELERRIKITVQHLADALVAQGELVEAHNILTAHHPKSEKRAHIVRTLRAIALPDDEHCDCPPEQKHVKQTIWVPGRQRFVEVLECQCGHLNASETPPDDVIALRQARGRFTGEAGAHDGHVFGHTRRGA